MNSLDRLWCVFSFCNIVASVPYRTKNNYCSYGVIFIQNWLSPWGKNVSVAGKTYQDKLKVTFGNLLSSSTKAMMFMGFCASVSRTFWLSTKEMCCHFISSLLYSSWKCTEMFIKKGCDMVWHNMTFHGNINWIELLCFFRSSEYDSRANKF